ncbi:hypothetical protein [Vogesella sp. LIG4]|uniref:hypothetical protein n=1 Tax=Vogesella sp. LIG4 TaxID=1192162 RepID=UPI0008201640|nr:hypothetical protein [Vogesella sp. LIG4]SCK06635.1 hypothetical protein PSELUDRAFT_0275 [Vogesella sp. LIG4]
MGTLLILLTCVVGVIFAIAVATFYIGCLGATMAALNNGRIVWGSLSFFLPPLALLYGIRNRQQVGWSYGFMVKGGAVVAVMLLVAWGGLHLLPEPTHGQGDLMERLMPPPEQQ